MYRDLPVCTVLYCHGTLARWYKVAGYRDKVVHWHDGTRNGIWRYMDSEVHGSTRICKTVHTGMYYWPGTYLFLLFNLDPAGFAAAMLPGRRRCIKDNL